DRPPDTVRLAQHAACERGRSVSSFPHRSVSRWPTLLLYDAVTSRLSRRCPRTAEPTALLATTIAVVHGGNLNIDTKNALGQIVPISARMAAAHRLGVIGASMLEDREHEEHEQSGHEPDAEAENECRQSGIEQHGDRAQDRFWERRPWASEAGSGQERHAVPTCLTLGKVVGAIMNPHVFFGVIGIVAVVVGSIVNIFPDAARKAVLKQPSLLPKETVKWLYSRTLVRTVGIGQVIIGVAFIFQWVVSEAG
ncbi:hypothetical protein, partial [Curtobacterium sp. VKM Ac-2887]|uniref:hypothetical protein n=1 Tax=Curtobacterium sp. VKM Ac-2887 TaxID=2783819 RepID=UPI001E336EB1